MGQKEVKIIGLKINQQLGIIQGCNLAFDKDNKLISIKGEVGAGKTTLQRGLQLGTLGSNTLKDDKSIYGSVDEEIQLLDGENRVFVSCKSDKEGGLKYVIYCKDEDGNKITEPIIDGVKLTPSTYLKSLQTALTWRMDELTSENKTVQRNLLLQLYKKELAGIGVVFDKKSDKYSDSILGRIESVEQARSNADFHRKQVGGFANHLKEVGIDVDNESTIPSRSDIDSLITEKNKIQFSIDNVKSSKESKLNELKNKADSIVLSLKEKNQEIKIRNSKKEESYNLKTEEYKQNEGVLGGIKTDLLDLKNKNCFTDASYEMILKNLNVNFDNPSCFCEALEPLVVFNDEGQCLSNYSEWNGSGEIKALLKSLDEFRTEYNSYLNSPAEDTSIYEDKLIDAEANIQIAKKNNHKCDMVDAFLAWRDLDRQVRELKSEYSSMLIGINTGVDGLSISVDSDDSKMDIYLTYNGQYSPDYFNNLNGEYRKLSSYSGTQKPIICLLLQNYLLSRLPKAMRYLWIDNVPIDNKTKELLNKMGEELGVTIIVNITGDFTRENLQNGEILVEGGEVFFN